MTSTFSTPAPPVTATPTAAPALRCAGVGHHFGDNRVLFEINLTIHPGEIVALVGPSGSGKSTLLRAILGTHPPAAGRIFAAGRPVLGPTRDIGIVYQRYSLFPFLTAVRNVAAGPMFDQTKLLDRLLHHFAWRRLRAKHKADAADWLRRVGLERAADLYPSELSGGMQQRVAIAQAMILRPSILLLDEPFGALDEATREELQHMLLNLYAENLAAKRAGLRPPHTILIVTHELNEALYVSDRVLGLSQFWRWEDEGLNACPGATIIYDDAAPVFDPDAPRDYQAFHDQREELRRIVFEPSPRCGRSEHVRYESRLAAGDVAGVMAVGR